MSPELFRQRESLSEDAEDMCDACGEKLRFIGKKACLTCQLHFCTKCLSPPQTPSVRTFQHTCMFCCLRRLDVIERSHLDPLAPLDLRYYARRKSLNVPINGPKDELIDVILAEQARSLAERARLALRQVSGSSVDVDGEAYAGASGLEGPHLSTYSTTATRGVASTATRGAASSSTPSDSTSPLSQEANESKRVKEDIDVSQVTNVDMLTHESQISELSVKQLKLILQRNCINYRGCVEKRELLEKVVRLWQAKQEEKIRHATITQMGDVEVESDYLCKVCMDSPVDCVLLECGHMLTCVTCGRQLSECPICRQYVTRVVHAFRV